jgi:Rrf2 family protein
MLRISKKADYAVFLLGAIARQGAYPGGPAEASVVSAHEIARQAGLNKSVVANLLKEFAKHGILESVRGLKGGYKLVRTPREVTLGEILEVVEGRFTLVDCIDGHEKGHEKGHEHAHKAPPHAALETSVRETSLRDPSAAATACDSGRSHLGSPLLALARRQPQPAGGCSLIAFCPSKQPMRVVHERISQLFHQIRLDELCGLPQTAGQVPTTSHTAFEAPASLGHRP